MRTFNNKQAQTVQTRHIRQRLQLSAYNITCNRLVLAPTAEC